MSVFKASPDYSKLDRRHRLVSLRAPVAEELPHAADLLDHVEVHLGGDQLILVLRADRQEIAARVHEVGGAVELADIPRGLRADPVAASHEVAVGDRVRRLLELPEVLRQPRHRGRRIEDDLGAVQSQKPRALREVPVVTDVHADDRKSTRLNSSHVKISYAVFCLKKKKKK